MEKEKTNDEINQLAYEVRGAIAEVHHIMGPGLMESAYEFALIRELELRGIPCQRQVPVPVFYKGVRIKSDYIIDLLVDDCIIIELKSVDYMSSVCHKQLVTYLKLTGKKLGFLVNFNSNDVFARENCVRVVNKF